MIIMFADQNFIPVMRSSDSCTPIVRVEDASLDELANIALEIFDKQKIPAGTLFMFSSVSALSKIGTTIYTCDWIKLCNKIQNRWPNTSVGPLPPILRDDSTGMVGRQLMELTAWFDVVYSSSIAYPKGSWHKLIDSIASNEEEGVDHTHNVMYTIALPRSILDRTLVPFHFHYSSTHSVTHALDATGTKELLCALLETLKNDFACSTNFEDLVLEEPVQGGGTEMKNSEHHTVVIIGASHCSRLCRELRMRNVTVIDLSVPGWTPTDGNVAKVIDEISTLGNLDKCIAIIDVLSNVTYRYEQYDGSLALPCKVDGTYHMNGKVQVCGKESILNTLLKTKEIFTSFPGQKIVLSPIPRYLFTPCCDQPGHCTDTGEKVHIQHLLEGTLGLRRHMQDGLVKAGVGKFEVPDIVQRLTDEKCDYGIMSTELKRYTSLDGVHLNSTGTSKLADVVMQVIKECCDTADTTVAGPSAASSSFYWRGFKSPCGAERPKKLIAYKMARTGSGGRWKETHPYRKFDHGGAGRGRGHYGGRW
jgi:hypothetical protein